MPVTIIVAILNFFGSLLPSLPSLVDEIRGHPGLNADGKAVLDALSTKLDADVERVHAAAQPLPDPDPTPNARGGA